MKSKAYAIIYKHENKLNGKVYIGQTIYCDNPDRRFRKNGKNYRGYKGSTGFFKALKKYGWNGFETTLLCSCMSKEDTDAAEKHFIQEFNSLLPNGYNSVLQTETTVVYTDEVRQKISDSRKRYYENLSEPIIAPNRNHHKIINGVAHKHCSDCDKDKPLNEFGKYKKTWDGLTYTCKECKNAYKREKCKYVRKSPEEVKQSYVERGKNFKNNLTEKGREALKNRTKAIKKVDVFTGQVTYFKSGVEASQYGFSKSRVSNAINYKQIYKDSYWYFVD